MKNVNFGKGPCLAGVKVHRPCLIISDVSTAVNLLRLLYIVAERQQQLQANSLIYASKLNVLDVQNLLEQNLNIIVSYQQEICPVPSNNFILFCLLKGRAFICNMIEEFCGILCLLISCDKTATRSIQNFFCRILLQCASPLLLQV
jgi:hypothetical protein